MKGMRKEFKCLLAALFVYVFMCGVLFLQQTWSHVTEPLPPHTSHQHHHNHDGAQFPREGLPLLESLIKSDSFLEQGIKLKWIGERIDRLSHSWHKAQHNLSLTSEQLFENPKKILLFPGLVSEYSAYDFANNAYKGGYLGELVQWSDLIASLHLLGHQLTLFTSSKQLKERVKTNEVTFDLVYTDYLGLYAFHDSKHFALYKCRFRILDSFGTEPLYNFRTAEFEADKSVGMYNNWNFEDTRQLLTLFPHTPDNSFLGFVVEEAHLEPGHTKQNQGLVYGKEGYYILGRERYLDVIGESIALHSTFKEPVASQPAHITNHGVLPQAELQKLLQDSKLFVGLGFPYDGPGPLEALANGCAFIQPLFPEHRSYKNDAFFRGKPTSRELSTQVPYLFDYVGEPYVYTVDVSREEAIREAVRKALGSGPLPPYIPYEFSQQGMMERLGVYIQHQDLCDGTDLAVGKTASSSSVHGGHSASEAVDGEPVDNSCFWSAKGRSHWWTLDLSTEHTLSKIRVTNQFEWLVVKGWGKVFINPFVVTLLDSRGERVASKRFNDSRTFYLWENINLRARSIRLDSLEYTEERYFVLCGVEVYGSDAARLVWPDLTLLRPITSQLGESCKNACFRNKMLCEPSFFKPINTQHALREKFSCRHTSHVEERFEDFLPGFVVDNETCVTTGEPLLLSCAGHHKHFQRLCPCREFTKGQIAVPPVS